jgi:glycosyltransferase involved in cell wall biosynthesis
MPEHHARTVLHISEAFGGGVVAAVHAHVAASPEFRHLLAFSDRREAPLSGHDLDRFDAVLTLSHEPRSAISTIRRAVRAQGVDVVHVHSSIAGAVARIALRSSGVPVVYSPHCLAHLRQDRSRVAREVFRRAEMALGSATAVYAACSPFELEQCARLAPEVPRVYVPNALEGHEISVAGDGDPHLLGVGRLLPQKDPEFFARAVEVIRASGIDLRATWIGDGEPHLRRRLEAARVEVTGWLPREESLHRLAHPGGIYLHSALWEGFPFAILEAHVAGLPLIIRHIPSLADFSFRHEVRDPSDVAQAVKELLEPGPRAEAIAADAGVLKGNNPRLARERLLEAYQLALASEA